MGVAEVRRPQLEKENRRLKQPVVYPSVDEAILQDALQKKAEARPEASVSGSPDIGVSNTYTTGRVR